MREAYLMPVRKVACSGGDSTVLQSDSRTCPLLFMAYCAISSALSWRTWRIRQVRGIWTPSQSETSQPGTGFARCMLALPRGGERAAVPC